MDKRFIKTFSKGVPKTRTGSPPMSLQTIIDRAKMAAFSDEIKSSTDGDSPVTVRQARAARKVLSGKGKLLEVGNIEAGLMSAAAGPVISGVGRVTKAIIDAKKNRGRAAKDALMATTRGGVASDAVKGLLFATAVSAGRKGLRRRKAMNVYNEFKEDHMGKGRN